MRVLEKRRTGPDSCPPSAARRFADALLGRTTRYDVASDAGGSAGPLSPEQARLIEHFHWLMALVPSRAAEFQRQLEQRLAEEAARPSELSTFARLLLEDEWDSSKHPRRGGPPNAGWFADKGTGTTAAGDRGLPVAPVSYKSGKSKPVNKRTLSDLINRRRQIDNLTGGGPTRQTMRAQGVAAKIASAGKLSGAVAGGFGSGAKTGGKALINGGATAVKNVATLGLSASQLELIGVTDEDRANGYDTAVAIATASGEVLITVGTGGVAAALSKGGTVARSASGALVAYDAAGNAVGVVQGIYDAATDGVSVRNAASVTGNALGLSSNVRSMGDLAKGRPKAKPTPSATPEEIKAFVDKLPRRNTPATTAANQYEIRVTGEYNYKVSGGGAKLDIDGFEGTTILEAKHVGNPAKSPFIPESDCYPRARENALRLVRSELLRARQIIESGETPFRSIDIVTNSEKAKAFFEQLMKELGVPGIVRVVP